MIRPPPRSPLFPYPTPFRSAHRRATRGLTAVELHAAKYPHRVVGKGGEPPAAHRILVARPEEHTSELQSRLHLVCRLLLEKKKQQSPSTTHVTTSGTLHHTQ